LTGRRFAVTDAPVIQLRNISKDYETRRALNDVSLTVNRGEIFGYIGGNGAGKTTTIKILTGLIRPSAGEVIVCGRSVTSAPLEVKARIGYVPESGAVFDKLSPREYLTVMGGLHRLSPALTGARIDEWLEFFGLEDRIDQRIEAFSKGMKQKICWIAAIIHDPEVLILDEPLSGLDIEAIAAVKELMRRWAANGKTIFYSSHLIDIVEKICSRIAILHNGRLIGSGSVDDLRGLSASPSLEGALVSLWQQQDAAVPVCEV
jgi:ABC-2 type transport system ATP-binding protein